MNGTLPIFRDVAPASPLSLTLSPEGRGDHWWEAGVWEARPRADFSMLRVPQMSDRGEHPSGHKGAAPTGTPSPLEGEGGGEGADVPKGSAR
jgi:hypothetical protein